MRIVTAQTEFQVLGAFEDHLYEQDQKRPALRLRLVGALTSEDVSALNGQRITLLDDFGSQIGVFEGYNLVHECTLTLVKEPLAEE